MAHKKTLSRHSSGQFRRRIGRDEQGRELTLYLGREEQEAKLRNIKLESFWAGVAKEWGCWCEPATSVAKAIANGQTAWQWSDRPGLPAAANAIMRNMLQAICPIHIEGVSGGQEEIDKLAARFDEMTREEIEFNNLVASKLNERAISQADLFASKIGKATTIKHDNTLHHALQAYRKWAESETSPYRAADGSLKAYAYKLQLYIDMFLERHKDINFAHLTYTKCEEMVMYWKNRPQVKGRRKQCSVEFARKMIKTLKAFLRWVSRNEAYTWTMPGDLATLRVKIEETNEEIAQKMQDLPTWTAEEIRTLLEHATDLERLWILLGLNCGFKQAEISTLARAEVRLGVKHKKFSVTDWIGRIRRKSGVYGEWSLWPETVKSLKEMLSKHQDELVIYTRTGTGLHGLTKGGNHNMKIANSWGRLIKRVQAKQKPGQKLRFLPFTSLRDTAANMIRDIAGGEVAGIFLCHGAAVRSDKLLDLYSNRPFDKVFSAIEQMHDMIFSNH